ARQSRKHQYVYINGRRVNDYLVDYRVREAFHTLLDHKEKPIFLLNISLPFDLVDVNVHPRKAEVKFQRPQEVYRVVEEAVMLALNEVNLVPRAELGNQKAGVSASGISASGDRAVMNERGTSQTFSLKEEIRLPLEKQAAPLAQLYATYILAQDEEGIMLIDQHAAQERMMFEKLSAISSQRSAAIQSLLLPETIELGWQEVEVLQDNMHLLQNMGIDIAVFGEREFIVRAVPVVLAHVNLGAVIRGLVDELLEEKKGKTPEKEIEKKLIQRACRMSVKAHEVLTQPQMQKIISDLFACEQPFTCPHGRPTMLRLTQEELERLFARR
ncbi:MAG TPA: hypothetical protein PKL83_03920, partial [bacterium]|nr:hypothetical protein [bacterium]